MEKTGLAGSVDAPQRSPADVANRPVPPPGFFEEEEDIDQYHKGIATFNAGDHYKAHDHFEALWGEDFWKGLVQAAVALHHYQARNPKGIEGLPENVDRILKPYRPHYAGIDVERFLSEFNHYFHQIQTGNAPPLEQAPRLHSTSPDHPTDPEGKQ